MTNQINPEIARQFQARLREGEALLWQSQPDPLMSARSGAVSGRAAILMFLMGMLWLRGHLWIAFNHPAALLHPSFWSPFVLIAAVLAWGAWSAYRSALRTGYAVTDRRLLVALSRKEPIFSGQEREAWGYTKLSVAASSIGTVTLAPSANARGTTMTEVRDAVGLFNFVSGDLSGTTLTGLSLLPALFDPAQIFLAPGEQVLWQAKADHDLLAGDLTKNAFIAVALIEGICALLTPIFLGLISSPPMVYILWYTGFLAFGLASWFFIIKWADTKAARATADRFYALTDRRLVITRRTGRIDVVQFALNRLEVRENIPSQHKIRLRTARSDDPEMLYVADAEECYAQLTAAIARANGESPDAGRRATSPLGNTEPDLSGEDPFRKQLCQGEEILWRGDSKGGGRAATFYALGMFTRTTLFIVAFPLVMNANGVGWGVTGGCLVLTALVMLSFATTAWESIRHQEYAITSERLLIVKTSDKKRRFFQANLREPVNISLSIEPKTGRGEFEITCREFRRSIL